MLTSGSGFKTLNQAQLLHDSIYWQDGHSAQQWLIQYISKPLVGSPEPLFPKMPPTTLTARPSESIESSQPDKPDIKGFKDILDHYPIIARQMQPGLDQLFQQFTSNVESGPSAPLPPSKPNKPRLRRSVGSFSSMTTLDGAQSLKSRSSVSADDQPVADHLRQALENMVASAIDIFQGVDKNQLSFLGTSANLSGPAVEQMIERYVTEFFHHEVLFPRVCNLRKSEDSRLDSYVRQMTDVDMIQAGAEVEGGHDGRRELSLRLEKAVNAFRRMGTASSPQEMMEILLETEKCVMVDSRSASAPSAKDEKVTTVITTNADLLVSMLMIVVIRSSIKHLHARLLYMLEFTFIEEVETGEVGYALSTFEAVLSYLSYNSSGLRQASQANRAFWKAVRRGDVNAIRDILESESAVVEDDAMSASVGSISSTTERSTQNVMQWINGDTMPNNPVITQSPVNSLPNSPQNEAGLAHVFPFEATSPGTQEQRPKAKKKVSMDTRSLSSSSAHSRFSRASTILSTVSIKGETSPQKICQTQDSAGNSALMMAVEKGQHQVLQYLLQQEHLFPLSRVLNDCNNDGTTLFSAAVQIGGVTVINTLVSVILNQEKKTAKNYISRQDVQGRCAAHYLFNAPHLIDTLNPIIPWQLKDRNGQTPLFALCRSYDNDNYHGLLEKSLAAASAAQAQEEGSNAIDLDAHLDGKSNSLLHIVNDAKIIKQLLRDCDSDPNAKNDKQFTPLMVASKFARLDSARMFFSDPRTDAHAREQRGLTAVELAKDDEVRNRVDDMVLLATKPISEGRVTTIVRSFFVEDGTIRMIVKSAAPNSNSTITVTTSRRSLTDFENLAKWLSWEQPASWMMALSTFRSPFHLPSKPSRTVLRDTQIRLDNFLHTLLAHPSFATHEMLWEFFLVPDIDSIMLAQRAHAKSVLREENLREEYTSITTDGVPEIELFISHATDQVRITHDATSLVFQSVNRMRNTCTNLLEAHSLLLFHVDRIGFLPSTHHTALKRHAAALHSNSESSPLSMFHYHMHSSLTNIDGLLASLARPGSIIASMRSSAEQIAKHEAAAQRARNQRWPSALGLLDDARRRLVDDGLTKAEKARVEMENQGRELAYTQGVVAAELAGFWEMRAKTRGKGLDAAVNVREGLRVFARESLLREKERLGRLRRILRMIGRERGRGLDEGMSDGVVDDMGESEAGVN